MNNKQYYVNNQPLPPSHDWGFSPNSNYDYLQNNSSIQNSEYNAQYSNTSLQNKKVNIFEILIHPLVLFLVQLKTNDFFAGYFCAFIHLILFGAFTSFISNFFEIY